MTSLLSLGKRPRPPAATRPLRVLLISPSYAAGRNTLYFPIGLSYLSAHIRRDGHQVVPLNMNNHGPSERYAELDRLLREEAIDVVGVGGLTIAFAEIEKIVAFVRARTPAPVVLGGGITSCESELVMRAVRPEFMVVGEGEVIFSELLAAIGAGQGADQVAGVWGWREGAPVYSGEGKTVEALDELAHPDLDLFGMESYLDIQSEQRFSYHETLLSGARHIPITASRSCPFRCTFCYHAGMGAYKRHSIENVVGHIEACLARFGVRYFMIYDELFSANKKRIAEFCERVKPLGITWYCQLRVDQLDQALLRLMKDAGCIHISYGFESGSNLVLDSMQKKISAGQIADAVAMTREARIGIQANFLFGDPAENEETLAESLRFQDEHHLYFVDWSAVIPYPGTQVYAHAEKTGLIPDREAFLRSMGDVSRYLWRDMVNMTELSDARYRELYLELRERNDRNHRKQLTLVEAGRPLSPTSSRMTLRCPRCGHRDHDVDIPYPPETASGGPPALRSPIGLSGLNIVCLTCREKHHLLARAIPHVGAIYAGFQAELDRLRATQQEVVVLPAMDRYFGLYAEDIDLAGLRLTGVLDSRSNRIGQTFLGHPVAALDEENVRARPDQVFLVLPWVEYAEALALLDRAGVPPQRVLSWNACFGAAMAPPAPTPAPADRAPVAAP